MRGATANLILTYLLQSLVVDEAGGIFRYFELALLYLLAELPARVVSRSLPLEP